MLSATQISRLRPNNPDRSIPPKAHHDAPKEDGSTKAIRVMVVDDEIMIAESLVEILRGEGFQAIAVSDGTAAIKWAETFELDAVICDIAMPVIDGFEVAKQIHEMLPDCRIILFSGHVAVHRMLANAQADGLEFEFLAKPAKPDVIISILRNRRPN
jgi:DNA-binding NtrC family response regulator